MGYLNDLISGGAFKPKNPLAAFAPAAPPAAIAAPAVAPAPSGWAPTPVANYAQPAPAYSGGGGGSAITQPGNTGINSSPAAPAPARKSEAEINAMADVDSTFMDQKSMYANALKKYIEDSNRQQGVLEDDAGVAQKGIARNREVGLTGLSEDFASRGLSNSGMFVDNLGKADGQYDKQAENVTSGLTNAKADLSFRRSKFEAENGENGTNIQAARREAYARLAAAQNLT